MESKSNTQKKDEFTFRKFYIDDTSDNYLLIKQNSKIIVLSLKLAGDSKTRRIGRITKSTRTIEMRRVRSKHLYRKGNAYGFCDYVLRYQNTFDTVRLSDDMGGEWKIPVSDILDKDKGFYLNFQQQGFELQKFISLTELDKYIVPENEHRRIHNGTKQG